MDDSVSDASHLQHDSGGLIAELDVKEYLETRERNAREDRAFAYKSKILDRAREVTTKTYQYEMRRLRNDLHDLSAKTPNFRAIPHVIHSGYRPRSYAGMKFGTQSTPKSYDPFRPGKLEDSRTLRSKSLPALERHPMVPPTSYSEVVGCSQGKVIPDLSTVFRCKTVDPQTESYSWTTTVDNTPRSKKSYSGAGQSKPSFNKQSDLRRALPKTLPPLKASEEHWRNSTKNIMRRNKFVQNSLSDLYKRRRKHDAILEEDSKPNFIIQRELVGQPASTIHASYSHNHSLSSRTDNTEWNARPDVLKI